MSSQLTSVKRVCEKITIPLLHLSSTSNALFLLTSASLSLESLPHLTTAPALRLPPNANPDALLPLPTTQWWGWSAATAADAVPAVAADKSAAHILARCPGGCPAVHDAVEQLGEVLAGLTTNHD